MDTFEVRLTPQRLKNTRMVAQNREPVRLMMAPFSSKSVITFEDIPVSKTARRFLIIENPTDETLQVQLSCKNTQKPIKNLMFEWLENSVPACSELTVEISWTPAEPVACKETFFVADQRGFKKELHIIFKSTGGKVAAVSRKPLRARNNQYLTTGAVSQTMRLRTPSPPPKKRVTGKRLSPMNNPPYKAQKTTLMPRKTTPKRANASSQDHHEVDFNSVLDLEDKENSPAAAFHNVSKRHGQEVSLNASDIFKSIQFTPAPDKSRGLDYMASLPTPKLTEVHHNVPCLQQQQHLSALSGKKIVWSPIFEGIREEAQQKSGKAPARSPLGLIATPEIVITTAAETAIVQSTTVKEYFNLELVPNPADARRSLFDEELEGPLLANSSTETYYIKDRTISGDVNQTRVLTPPLTQSHVFQAPLPLRETIANRVEGIVTTPLQKKASESMRNLSSQKNRQQEYLKLNQGSMPNLHEIESINSIESNRYYSQLAASQTALTAAAPPAPPPAISAYDSSFMLFKETEIRAQSSCSNLHELPDNTGLIKTNSERVLGSQDKHALSMGFHVTPAASRVKHPFMTLSPPKNLTVKSKPPSLDTTTTASAKWNQAVHLAAKAKRERERKQQHISGLHQITDTTSMLRMACQVPMKLEKRRVFYDAEMHVQAAINPDPFAATTTHDPFLSATMYLDEKATDKYEKQFKNWLNALVTVPVDMDSDQGASGGGLDVGRIFNEVRHNKKETVAQTKESVSCKYFTRYRMPLLRRAAVQLYMSSKVVVPLQKLDVLIEKKQIEMRADRNLHLDLVLQRGILELLLGFNTLWLRIGLEVVFGEEVPLTSNADIYGITSFVLSRLFRDKYLEGKYSKNFALTAKYAEQIKKHALRKLLHLIVFLDAAKEERIIKHNPCLFTRASPLKETKEVLIKVASHLIANIGDITKYVRRLGIVLVHKQTYLDEFDYAFTNLAVDLRDGIRLTKVMEIILLRDDLTKWLRYPAVSRLQKIHNVDVGLKALLEAEYQIHGEITAKDIVDGHREKTLSLLWQLIYKFRAPKFNAAATVVQRWWRVRMLYREVQHRIETKREQRAIAAALVIQKHWRGFSCRRRIPEYVRERTIATVVVQTYLRGFVARKRFLAMRTAAVEIQAWWRRNKQKHAERRRFVVLRRATLTVQRRFRANIEMQRMKREYSELRRVTVNVQMRWRANMERRRAVERFAALRRCTVFVQRRWRANEQMKQQREKYLRLRQATVTIQRRFRDYRLMQLVKMNFVKVQYSTIVIQRFFRGYLQMRQERRRFAALKEATVNIQRRFRANLEMREKRAQFVLLKRTVQSVEQRYQAKILAKMARMRFLRVKWATVTVQRQFRAQLAMRNGREAFVVQRESIVKIQRYFRGYLETQRHVQRFDDVKRAVRIVQIRFRANQEMIIARQDYAQKKHAAVTLQRWIRGNKARDVCRERFISDRQSIVQVQRRWRAKLEGRVTRRRFEELRNAAIVIQRRIRATQHMKEVRTEYQAKKQAVIVMQRRWRARQIGVRVQREYAQKRELIVAVQRRVRATLLMRRRRSEFVSLKMAATVLQTRWRARQAMRVAVAGYQEMRRYSVIVQTQWRATLRMRVERLRYQQIRHSAVEIQRHFRGYLVRQEMRRRLLAVQTLQMYYRLWVERRRCQGEYQRLREATVTVQREWRRRCEMRQVRAEYLYRRELIVRVQRRFRALQAMRREREQYLLIHQSVVVLQQRLRAVLQGRRTRQEMEHRRTIVIRMQSLCRGVLARAAYRKLWYEKMSPEAIELRKRNAAALRIQCLWRGYRARKRHQSKAIRVLREKVQQSRRVKQQDRVTVKLFLGASMLRLKLGLNVSDATKIFKSLDFYSRVVPHVLVANCVQVARYCYTMLSQATRSEPHKYLIELCCRVALNLARYEETRKQIFLGEYLETIGQMLLRWSDKECPIFNTLSTLIYVFIQTPNHKKIIYNYMTMHDGGFILKETEKAVIRKEKMLTNKQKLGVYRTQSTETGDVERLPTLECDYGIEMPTHLYVFKSRVFALDTILRGLDIDLH